MKLARIAAVLCGSTLSVQAALGYGKNGHQIVGAIADQRLAQDDAKGKPIYDLIDGMTLERAATIPDELKSFDSSQAKAATFKLAGHAKLEKELREFLKANMDKVDGQARHRTFHYTDVAVAGHHSYHLGDAGTSQQDIVQMITVCVGVLEGTVPESNPFKITKGVAVILLAHYVGDIHQPLHVGAEYFNDNGEPADPNTQQGTHADQGGNKIELVLARPMGNLHAYWDENAVDAAVQAWKKKIQEPDDHSALTHEELATFLADPANEPKNWKPAGAPATWSEQWADEIIPIARQAHEKLEFSESTEDKFMVDATDTNGDYAKWASQVVQKELHKGGWRLAELLETCVK